MILYGNTIRHKELFWTGHAVPKILYKMLLLHLH